jgi:hypothetical protein
MSYRKFGKNDVLINTMKAHPKSEFFIYSGTVYYNNRARQTGEFQSASANPANIYMTPPGYVNLYEYNIDRLFGNNQLNPTIHPFVTKDGSRATFFIDGTETEADFGTAEYGDLILGTYPQSASLRRDFMTTHSGTCHGEDTDKTKCQHNMFYWSLRTMLNHYGTRSPHYLVSSSYGTDEEEGFGWNKDTQKLNLIHIPSIFYGSKIRPGTVSLQWYFTGSLIAELKDERENGELIQTGPPNSNGSGSVAGVVLYNEGFILLTGSWQIDDANSIHIDPVDKTTEKDPRWIYWGLGIRGQVNGVENEKGPLDNFTTSTGPDSPLSASFGLSFEGVTKTEVLTMYARAPRGKVNYSNNPTFLKYDQPQLTFTSSHIYEENKNRLIKNTVSSSYSNYNEDFKRQVYISKVAVYDNNRQLIGVATLSNPVLKKEEEDLAIKIKLDM